LTQVTPSALMGGEDGVDEGLPVVASGPEVDGPEVAVPGSSLRAAAFG
jgi:hypothetical protein